MIEFGIRNGGWRNDGAGMVKYGMGKAGVNEVGSRKADKIAKGME